MIYKLFPIFTEAEINCMDLLRWQNLYYDRNNLNNSQNEKLMNGIIIN